MPAYIPESEVFGGNYISEEEVLGTALPAKPRSVLDVVSSGVGAVWDRIPSSGHRLDDRGFQRATKASAAQVEDQAAGSEIQPSGAIPYNRQTGRYELDGGVADFAGDVGAAVLDLPQDVAATARGAIIGNDPRAVAESDLIKAQNARGESRSGVVRKYGLGLDSQDIQSSIQSLPFSLASMAAYLGASIPTALVSKNPVAANAAGMAASGAAAYRMDTAQVLGQVYGAANKEFKRQTGRDMTPSEFEDFASRPDVQGEVRKHGAAEAGFEALGNFVTSNAFAGAIKGSIGKAAAKEATDAISTKAADSFLKAGIKSVAGELATETPTQIAQSQAETALGLQGGPAPEWTNPDDWAQAFKEVAWPTLLTSGAMGGAAKIAERPLDAFANRRMAGKITEFVTRDGHLLAGDSDLAALYARAKDVSAARPDDAEMEQAVKTIQDEQIRRANSSEGYRPGADTVRADDVLGTPSPEQSEAEKALYTPKSLTALDRVNEIDTRLAAATPEESSALQAERDRITESWPTITPGAETSFTTEAGARLAGQYALVEAESLVTSHDENLRPVAAYPAELQPRERERHASEMQIQQIVGRLDPARLGESADVSTGAPIVGADGLVESGNARTIALKRVYQANGAKADGYRAFLKANAERFGITAESVDAMQKPVLVRVRNTPVNRAEFARQANAATVARMSPSEQAKSDAAQIDSLDDLNPDEAGEFMSGSSAPFVRRFLSKLAGTESAGLVDASGRLSQAGYTRIRNAVLAKAYGDSPVLLRMVESLDDNTRNVSKALLRVAPQVAKAREAMGEGALHNVDLIPDLMAAVEELSDLKEKGVSIDQAIAQAGMFGDKISPEAQQILVLLNENARSPRRIADFIQAYLDALTAAGNPGQGSMFDDNTAPSKSDLMTAARRTTNADTETSGTNAGDAKPAQKGGSQPGDAPRDQAGNGRNEAAGGSAQVTAEELSEAADKSWGLMGVGARNFLKQWVEAQGSSMLQRLRDAAKRLWTGDTNASTEEDANLLQSLYDAGAPIRALLKSKADSNGQVTLYRGLRNSTRDGAAPIIESFSLSRWTAQNFAGKDGEVVSVKVNIEDVITLANEPEQEVLVRPKGPKVGAGGTAQQGEWVAFPPDTGTLGIPRADMPQVKGEHRGALIQFLDGLGITHKTVEMPASKLKPTQAEFSTKKAEGWKERKDGSDRSVLASSDGYILDGHHQWVAALALGETEQVIQFSVPIKELLAATFRFPSVQQSEGSGNVVQLRTQARQDFKDALADLAQIATKHTRAAMLPENTPNLMPTLIKLSGAAIAEVGYQIKDIIAHVKKALHADSRLKAFWNKIGTSTYRKAAEQAAAQESAAHVDDLFSAAEARRGQGDLFARRPEDPQVKQGVAMIDGRPYDRARDNFKAPHISGFLESQTIDEANAAVEKYYKGKPGVVITAEERARAEALLTPLIAKAEAVKEEYDQKIIDITKRSGAIGQMLAPIKSMKRSVEKLVDDEDFDIGGMKDVLRSTIVVSSYADVQAVMNEIEREFSLLRDPKNRTGGAPIVARGKTIEAENPKIYGGYSDVMVNVVLPSGVIAEIQINVPEMLGAKEGPDFNAPGHKLYEAYREAPKESPLGQEIKAEMEKYYAAVSSAISARKSASDRSHHSETGPRGPSFGLNDNSLPSSESLYHLPSGNSTKNPPSDLSPNLQPSGNLSGTRISSTSNDIVADDDQAAYNLGKNTSTGSGENGNDGDGKAGTESKGSGAVSGAGGSGHAAGVSGGPGRGNQSADSNADGGTGGPAGGEQGQEPSGKGGNPKGGGRDGNGNRSGRNAGLPAGRDIPVKSGRNYAFGDGDLTYSGSWNVKARQNVEAVELLKKLEAEKRQATREEQAVLAKFIGWGASEIANSLFGEKLNAQLEAIRNYEAALSYLDNAPYGLRQRDSGYYQAFKVLASSDPKTYGQHSYYSIDRITRDMLEKAKPDMGVKRWAALRDRLEAVLSPEEWKSASKSTQYAHYTSKPVVKSLLAAVAKMGFKGGSILEPGAGIGVFPGLMDASMATNSVYTGIEYDPITGGILKQLFPDERILVESFIDSKLPENFYDVAFGNPPFSGEVTVLADPKYVKNAFKLHDYFFAKSIDSVKPGGLVVFVTSRYTMDKKGDKARTFMAERVDLVGAIRLPQTAFQKNAGTDVVTDVLFLRKKVPGQAFDKAQPWLGLGEVSTPEGSFLVNEYFAAHPEMVLGEHSGKGKMQNRPGPQYTLLATPGDIEAQFAAAVETLPSDVFVAGRGSAAEAAKVREMDFDPKAKKEGSFYVSDAGVLMQREGGVGIRAEDKYQKNAGVIKDYIALRDAVKQSQLDQLNDGDWETSLKALQKAYADFTKKNGRLFQNTTYMQKVKVDELDDEGVPTGNKIEDEEARRRFPLIAALRADPEYTLALALEDFNEETGEIKDSDWLTKRTLGKPAEAEVRTPADALLATLNDTGVVDIPAVAGRLGMSETETIDALGSLVYEDPAQGWVMADEYLSGNVKSKLARAEEAARSDKAFARNVEALKAVQPAPLPPEQITPQIGMNWIPGAIYEQFLFDVTGVKAKIDYVKRTRDWVLTTISGEGSARATSDWGVGDKAHAGWLMEKTLSGAPISLNKSEPDGKGGYKQVFDAVRTEAANEKRIELRRKFREWLFQDAQRTTELVQLYNDKFNTNVQRKFDGRHLTLPGTSKLFKIYDHVKRGAWRVIQTGNTYLAHAVGSGKTFEMVISAMEQKRLGKIKKPMMIVPGHMLQQFASEWQQLYPTARLMVADETDFHTENRRRFVSRVAMSDLDGVIMTHSSFGLLDLDPEFKQKMIEQELEVLRASYTEAGGDLDDIGDKKVRKEPKIKRIEAQIEKLEQQLAKSMSSAGKDKNVRFDEMGVDMLYVDEAHLFRKLSFATARQTKGIAPQGSQMAWDLYMKTRWLAEKNPTRNLVMASGTAITNTTAELYTVQRFMAPHVLEENGLEGFDDWASQFGEESTTIESTASGKYEPVTRFQEFINVGEMTQMFRDFADVLNEDQLAAILGDKRPKVNGGARKMVITPKTEAYARFLADVLAPRIERSKNWKPTFQEQFNPDPIIAINIDARLAAIDMRFMDPSLPSDPDSKLNKLIDGVIGIYKETANNEYRGKSTKDAEGNEIIGAVEPIKGATQMVFFETGFGQMVAQRRGFNARAWMEKRLRDAGVPSNQVAFMEDYKKSSAKLKLFADVNKGKVRVLVGSSAAMGTGVNAQQRLIALHHLDAPYVPAVLEQREGRIVRQGNKNPEVQIYAYSTFGSFDENLWQMLARKKFFIEQAMSGDPNIRSIEDVGEVNQLQMAAGLVAENPFVMQLAGARADVSKMTRLYQNHEDQRGRHHSDYQEAGRAIEYNEKVLPAADKAAERVSDLRGDAFVAKAGGAEFTKRKEWAEAILAKFKEFTDQMGTKPVKVGELSGLDLVADGRKTDTEYRAALGVMTPTPTVLAHDPNVDPSGMAIRATNALVEVQREPDRLRKIIEEMKAKRISLEPRLNAPFPLAEQLANKVREVADLEDKVINFGKQKTAYAREQELEDAWAERTGAITPMFSRGDEAILKPVDTKSAEFAAWSRGASVRSKGFKTGQAAVAKGYHGTQGDIYAFDPDAAPNTFEGDRGLIFVTSANKKASGYAEDNGRDEQTSGANVMPVFVAMANPKVVTIEGMKTDASEYYDEHGHYLVPDAKDAGHDGLIIENLDTGELLFVAFRNTQVKSAISNTGAFDSNNSDIRYSRGSGRGMALRDLQATVDRVSRGFKNLPRVHVMESPASLSTKDPAQKALRDYIRKSGAWDDVEGATHEGEIYLFASGLADEARAEHVLATHEVTHYGLRGAVGADLDTALQHVLLMNARIRKAAVQLKTRLGLKSNLDAIEEVLADLTPGELMKLRGWRKVVQVVRNWLNKAGAKNLAARLDVWMKAGLTDQEQADLFVADLVNAARDWVRSGKGKAIVPGTKLAEQKLSDDWAAQEKWLAKEAKARGYKSIDDLAEKAYPVFEKLAALWRKKNPVEVALMSRKASDLRVVDLFGSGSRVQHFDDKRGLFYEAQKYPSGRTGWRAGEVIDGVDYWLSAKEFGSMAEAQAAVRGLRISNTAKQNSAEKYGAIPALWTGEARRVAKAIIDAGVGVERFSASTQSKSKYAYLDSGLKVRLADHALPGAYDQPDVDYRYGGDIKALVAEIKEVEEGAPTPDSGELGSRSLGETKMQERPTVRADKSGSSAEPAQSGSGAGSNANVPLFSRAVPPSPTIRNSQTAPRTADDIINKKAGTPRPMDAVLKGATQAVKLDRATTAIYDRAAFLLDRITPEIIKAGMVSDYGVPAAVIDARAVMQGRQRQQLRAAGALLEKLSTLTRAESRVAYEWMNSDNPQAADYFREQLPPESIKTLAEVEKMIDDLSKEAIKLGQLDPDAYARNKFAYLRRSYVKHTAELTAGEAKGRGRAIAVLGDQYKGRGMTDSAPMSRIRNVAPEWWNRKTQAGKADKQLRGERFIRLERRQAVGQGVSALPGFAAGGKKPKLLEINYWPANEPMPARYGAWDQAGTWEVRDTKGGDLILWRDFSKQEREALGEIDEARFAIAKTLHGMIHDVETGKYLQWLGQKFAKKEGEAIDGEIVEAAEGMFHTFGPGDWVKVPDSVITGTRVKKYGALAGRYLPGPIWNDVRQLGNFRPLGNSGVANVYSAIHRAWKTSKTALSPAVHMNNVMANFVMADWHDVTAGHVAKALRLVLSKEAGAQEVLARFGDSGGTIGTWATKELQQEQLRPILDALEKELGIAGNAAGQVGVMYALQMALRGRLPTAWTALSPTATGKAAKAAARAMLDLYEAEDQVFRLAAWLKAKEEGASDLAAGKVARRSFLDYSINAPWVQMLRSTALPFVAFTYRSVPMLLEIAAKKPWKLMKLGLLAGAVNAFGYMLSGGDEDDERKLLPEEKAGRIWGLSPKLVRMPWNDDHGSPVFLDVRRWIPVGDIFDTGQSHAAVPLLPSMTPGGPMVLVAEIALNKQQFTGKEIALDTDTPAERAGKVVDYLWKAFAPNIAALPGTYAWTGIANAGGGKTDAFGREQSLPQAIVSSIGIKVGSYPGDVLRVNAQRETQAKMMEIDRNITALKRERQKNGIDDAEFQEKAGAQMDKKRRVIEEFQRRAGS